MCIEAWRRASQLNPSLEGASTIAGAGGLHIPSGQCAADHAGDHQRIDFDVDDLCFAS